MNEANIDFRFFFVPKYQDDNVSDQLYFRPLCVHVYIGYVRKSSGKGSGPSARRPPKAVSLRAATPSIMPPILALGESHLTALMAKQKTCTLANGNLTQMHEATHSTSYANMTRGSYSDLVATASTSPSSILSTQAPTNKHTHQAYIQSHALSHAHPTPFTTCRCGATDPRTQLPRTPSTATTTVDASQRPCLHIHRRVFKRVCAGQASCHALPSPAKLPGRVREARTELRAGSPQSE